MSVIHETHLAWASLMKGDTPIPLALSLGHRASMLREDDLEGQGEVKSEGFQRIQDERTKEADKALGTAKDLPEFQPNMWRKMSNAGRPTKLASLVKLT